MADSYKAFIDAAAAKLRVDPSIIATHTRMETAAGGTKAIGQFNYANIKAGSSWADGAVGATVPEFKDGKPVSEAAKFRSYANPEEAAADYARLLSTRYPGAAGAKTPGDFVQALVKGGYATDPQYQAKFLGTASRTAQAGTRIAGPEAPMVEPQYGVPARAADPLQEAMPGKATYAKGGPDNGAAALPVLPTPREIKGTDQVAEVQAQAILDRQEADKARVSPLEQARRSAASSGIVGAVIRMAAAKEVLGDNAPDPSFRIDPEKLVGTDSTEQEFLSEAVNAKDLDHRLWAVQDRRESQKIVEARGAGYALLAGAVSELPTSALLGVGVATAAGRLGLGSARLLAAGRPGAAVGYNIGENAAANAVAEGIQERIDPFHTWKDAAFNMTAGVLFDAALGSPTLIREGALGRRLSASAEEHGAARVQAQQAVEQAGVADPVQAHAEVQRAELSSIREAHTAVAAEAPEPVLHIKDEVDALSAAPPERMAQQAQVEPDATAQSRITQAIDRLRSMFRSGPEANVGRPDYGWDGWDGKEVWAVREKQFSAGGKHEAVLGQITHGKYTDLASLDALPAGIHKQEGKNFGAIERAADQLRTKFLGNDFKIVLMDADSSLKGADGAITMLRENTAVINIDLSKATAKQQRVIVHELGHAVWQKYLAKLTPEMRKQVDAAYQEFRRAAPEEQARMRYANSSSNSTAKLGQSKYELSRDEFSAEQFVKHIEDSVLNGGNYMRLDRTFADSLIDAVLSVIKFFKDGAKAFRKPATAYADMFDAIMTKQAAMNRAANAVGSSEAPAPRSRMESEQVNPHADQDIQRLGLHLFPMDTPQARAEVLAIRDLYLKAEKANIQVDESRLSRLLDTAVFEDGQSRANVLLRSKNPVARFIGATLVESPSGAAGRRKTAAIAKALHEEAFLGNSMNEVQAAYRLYRQEVGGSVVEDTWGGKHWEEFNVQVAREIEGRGRGTQVGSHQQVVKAADSLEAAYERMRTVQVQAETVGAGALPSTSRGYMPHRLSQEKIRNAGTKELSALHSALTDQFITDMGFDMSFADQLASKYIDRVKIRALGGADTPAGMAHAGAMAVVEDALRAAGMGDAEVKATLQRIAKAGPGHTKKRLQLDLNRVYDTPDGGTFRLGDLFEADQFTLLRSQASRVSGEVALSEHGVPGKAGLDMIRRALRAGEDGQQATLREVDAFDQIAAEFLGSPYGTQNKVIDRVLQANSLVRLGGLAWTQLSEVINGVVHLGVGRAMDSIVGIPRLIGEVRALSRGEQVNGVLSGMETLYGAEFGTLSYKTVFPFDSRSLDPHSYGQDTLTFMDRLLRGGGHLQGKLSMWRAIHSAQHRGMAEQIARKAVVYLQEGKSADVFLKDMGMSDELLAKLRADLPRMAQFDAQGRLLDLDVTKASDLDAAREFTQAVHRGVSQIIQGTFIGERSKWATDAHMRLLTQFRTFSLTAVEKQWGRQVGNVGTYKALGIMIGMMSAAFPIYAARMYANSIGRDDREEYLDKAFEPRRVARQLMNYGALWGLAPEFIDALGAVGGWNLGGRQGDQEQDFVGNVVAPAAGLMNDVYRAVQNTNEGTDLHKAVRAMPFTNLPGVVQMVNLLGD